MGAGMAFSFYLIHYFKQKLLDPSSAHSLNQWSLYFSVALMYLKILTIQSPLKHFMSVQISYYQA